MTTIPLTSAFADASQFTELSAAVYEIRATWNTRSAAWVVSLSRDGALLLAGRRLVLDLPLFDRFIGALFPEGRLLLVDLDGAGTDPGREDLGQRVALMYLTAAEVAEVRSVVAA